MCGICGIVHFSEKEVDPTAIASMMTAMKHRGPDDEGQYFHKQTGLGHVRLSIIDLSADGKQPMTCNDGRYTMVYNGEIYNYIELREKLREEFSFKTKTDTEVLLNAWKKWGESCLEVLNGMFAFAVHDKETGELFLARDRFGIKPLYYYVDQQQLIFASEIKPILTQLPQVQQNDAIIYDFLVYDRVQHTDETFFSNIRMLPHGHCMKVINGNVERRQWYSLMDRAASPFSSPTQYADSLLQSISLRMRSDVEVGACLSGGLDSSSIVSLMSSKLNLHGFHTFSATYSPGERGDESDFINCYRNEVGNMHFVTPSADSLLQDLDSFITAMEEPLPGLSEYAEFKVMELVKGHATVILNGQGADEVLAGYHYFFGYYYKELLNKLKLFRLGKEMAAYWAKHHSLLALKSMIYFYLPANMRERVSRSNKGYLNPGFTKKHSQRQSPIDELYGSKDLHASFLNHFEHKFEHHLIWGDKSSMLQSIELRFPFLDHRLVEKTLALSSDQLIRNGQTKYILREAMKGILPEKIRTRHDKVGFETPAARWLRSEPFVKLIREVLASDSFANRGYVDPKKAVLLYEQHLEGKKDASREIWKLVHLEWWLRKFID